MLALSPSPLPAPPSDPTNAHADDAAAATFGQKLFFIPIFAGRLLDGDNDGNPHSLGRKGDTGKVACASCHVAATDFSDTRSPSQQTSLAAGWGMRRAPSLLDVGQAKVVMWDGRHDTLYNQVFGPIESPLEMNSSRLYVAEQVFNHFKSEYEAVFGALPPLDNSARFPVISDSTTGCTPAGLPKAPCSGTWHGSPGDNAEFDGLSPEDQQAVTRVVVDVGKAIGAYERLLSCGPSRFDQWIHGDATALSPAEQRGAQVFVGAGRCLPCHEGPFLSDQHFHNVGLRPGQVASVFIDDKDRGAAVGLPAAMTDPLNSNGMFSDGKDDRLPIVASTSWEGSFRTPMLRCVARRPSYFHTGQARTLDAVVDFFDRGGDNFGFEGTSEIKPLGLTTQEKSDLVAFLGALNGSGAPATLTKAP
jgi:cytochrome c peroxidase